MENKITLNPQKYLCIFFDEQDKIDDSYIHGILTYKTNPMTIYIISGTSIGLLKYKKYELIRYLILKYR